MSLKTLSYLEDDYVAKLTEAEQICASKKFFLLEKQVAKELQKGLRKGYLRSTARYYRCNVCPGYHITNGRGR
jgi:hypothetical protein